MRVAIASLALAAGLAGCGSADTEQEAVTPLAAAVSTTQRETSARMTFQTVGKVSGQEVRGKGTGLVQFKPPKAQLTLTVSAAGQSVAIDEVMDGTTMYMKLPKEAAAGIPGGKTWISLDLDRVSGGAISGAMSQSQDPSEQLKLLSTISDAKAVGKDTLDGATVTHYRGVLDYDEIAKSGPESMRKAAQMTLKVSNRSRVPVDVWVDEQGRIRRQRFVLDTKGIAGSPPQSQTITTDYSDFGVDTSAIKAPSASDTYDATEETDAQLKDAGIGG
jgi:hypothetical protein